MEQVGILLFNDFETLDVYGPVEVFGRFPEHYYLSFYSLAGAVISNRHNVSVNTLPVNERTRPIDILLIPGGIGTRTAINDEALINAIRTTGTNATFILTVCTGAALLAKSGLLDNRRATSNKRAFDWARSSSYKVNWISKARWMQDGRFYTSSGVSAGIDMTLGFIADRHGTAAAEAAAAQIEYLWNPDRTNDPFAD
ncbi:dimethyladenosine transferase [Niabella ginsenosidivorans]|uniref:Dimethyladenosine transferase n=1 Tax=Niabella ginsenosidivorans TaxID=1176587 RepID=A0A1A9I270_9BACT|nr:DJ-1/PfpI family protein [Niabella ginsenosidivorans]ANH81757.1 dimethyladenosine transferase [Niabella ginsenosidivorans]